MRLIDADALMESIGCADAVKYGNRDRAQQDISYSTMMLYEVRDEIDAQPTVGGWISVKDRLPEPPAQCLVYSNKASRPRGMETATYTEWGWMTAAYFPEITHWMPLPESPEEVNRDD